MVCFYVSHACFFPELNDKSYCVVNLYLRPDSLSGNIDTQSYKLDKFKEVVEHCHPNLRQFLVEDILGPCEVRLFVLFSFCFKLQIICQMSHCLFSDNFGESVE